MTEIYKITCSVCNKIYIGKHKVYDKLLNSYLGSGKKQTQHLKEHKKENQVKEVILYCEDKDVKHYEEKFIELHNATNPEIGLNISKKSHGIDKHTEESNEKNRQSHLGKEGYWKNKKRIEISERMTGENHPLFNKHHSEKTKEKMKKSHLGKNFTEEHKNKISISNTGKKGYWNGRKNPKHSKKLLKSINVYDKTTDEFVKTFNSIKHAGKELNLWATNISKVLNGKLKSTGGYVFNYVNG